MKRHEVIYALRQYMTKEQLDQILLWPATDLLEKLLDFYSQGGKIRKTAPMEIPFHAIADVMGFDLALEGSDTTVWSRTPYWMVEKTKKRGLLDAVIKKMREQGLTVYPAVRAAIREEADLHIQFSTRVQTESGGAAFIKYH